MSVSILIIEDEIVLQDVYKFLLTSQGYKVYTANNGLEGIKQLKDKRPDIVLLDIFMPVMDGKEFLRNIDTSEYPNTKFVACTNLSDGETQAEMLGLGAHKFVVKAAMEPQGLIDLVAGMVANS
jgi:two-component system alkaline phosphatase synthesis response regulator PhoP